MPPKSLMLVALVLLLFDSASSIALHTPHTANSSLDPSSSIDLVRRQAGRPRAGRSTAEQLYDSDVWIPPITHGSLSSSQILNVPAPHQTVRCNPQAPPNSRSRIYKQEQISQAVSYAHVLWMNNLKTSESILWLLCVAFNPFASPSMACARLRLSEEKRMSRTEGLLRSNPRLHRKDVFVYTNLMVRYSIADMRLCCLIGRRKDFSRLSNRDRWAIGNGTDPLRYAIPNPKPHTFGFRTKRDKVYPGNFSLPGCIPGDRNFIEYPIILPTGLYNDGRTDFGKDRIFFQFINNDTAAYCGAVFHPEPLPTEPRDKSITFFHLCDNSDGGQRLLNAALEN